MMAVMKGMPSAVEVASSVLFLYCAGALVGPTVAATLMDVVGPQSLFAMNAVVYAGIVAYLMLRIRAREEVAAKTPVEAEPLRIK